MKVKTNLAQRWEMEGLNIEKLRQCIDSLPPVSYPDRIRISYPDYAALPLFPGKTDKIFMGIIFEPDLGLRRGEYVVEYGEPKGMVYW